MKKLGRFVVFFVLLITVCAATRAFALQSGDYTYTVSGGQVTITGYTGTGGDVVIPSTIDSMPVVSIGAYAFTKCNDYSSCYSLTSISIPNSVESIGEGAFAYVVGLTRVTIPASVISIGDIPFSNCSHLTSITVDALNPNYSSVNGVLYNKGKTILIACPLGASGAFTIPDGVIQIANNAFDWCHKLTSITIPGSVTSIGYSAFRSCWELTSVTILPGNMISINEYAFAGCNMLASVNLGNSVQTIGYGAFGGCESLVNITIPASITSIGLCAFQGCKVLTSISVSTSNLNYSSIGGVLYNKDGTTLVAYPSGKATTFSIPNGVKVIGDSAFSYCETLTDVVIPNSVTEIGLSAFAYCEGLTSIDIPGSVIAIGSASSGCAFWHCDKLSNITLHEGTKIIGFGAFGACTILSNITLPSSIVTIETSAFIITGLTNIVFPSNLTSIGALAFSGCLKLASITWPTALFSIGNNAFKDCDALTSVTLPSNVITIGNSPFFACSNLIAINVDAENSYYSSLDGVLYNKDATVLIQYPLGKIGEYIMPSSVTEVATSAMSGCSLTSLTLSNNLKYIRNNGIYNASIPSTITLPASVLEINQNGLRKSTISIAHFDGNAPVLGADVFIETGADFKVTYHEGKTGFTNPWYGYPTEMIPAPTTSSTSILTTSSTSSTEPSTTTTEPTTTTSIEDSSTTTIQPTTTIPPESSTTTTNGGGVTTTVPATTSIAATTTTVMTSTTTTTGQCPATKILGDDNPELEYLRNFRDSKLANSIIGRKVIEIYYNNADNINDALENSPMLRDFTKTVLKAIASMMRWKEE